MLNAECIEEYLNSPLWSIHSFDTVESTNILVKDYLRNSGSEGFVAVALEQDGGYGRQGRSWKSPLGGLYFSFSLIPGSNKNVSSVSLVVALALKEAFENLGVRRLQIKWPNDVLINKKKACGISLEGVAGGICVGIGINVFKPEEVSSNLSSSYETAYLGTELFEHENKVVGSLSNVQKRFLESLVIEFFNAFSSLYERWKNAGFGIFCSAYNSVLFNKGQEITLETITLNTIVEGIVQGVDAEGKLLLAQQDGSVVSASSGEVHTKH